jgi:hypothetical protein
MSLYLYQIKAVDDDMNLYLRIKNIIINKYNLQSSISKLFEFDIIFPSFDLYLLSIIIYFIN